jgi:hypothetical protein
VFGGPLASTLLQRNNHEKNNIFSFSRGVDGVPLKRQGLFPKPAQGRRPVAANQDRR